MSTIAAVVVYTRTQGWVKVAESVDASVGACISHSGSVTEVKVFRKRMVF